VLAADLELLADLNHRSARPKKNPPPWSRPARPGPWPASPAGVSCGPRPTVPRSSGRLRTTTGHRSGL